MRVVLVLLALVACGDNVRGNISVATPDGWRAAVRDFIVFTEYRGMSIGSGGDFHIELIIDPAMPAEGYRIDPGPSPGVYAVRASDILGAQYGLADALENLGFRYRHPFDAYTPFEPKDHGGQLGVVHAPEVRVRGFQLHTLHPIESYFAFWEPEPGNTHDAHRIIDWLIKNRGNYVHWVALDDIMDPMVHEKWKPFTRELIDYAHSRGVRVGLNIQLFGSSNLQLAFDLHDKEDVPVADSVAQRLPLITQDLPFDVLDLSFGEFFGEEPQRLIDSINEYARQARMLAPQAELHGFVHVGDTQRVDYMDATNLLYYFLLRYADPTIVPDIHTVMYYNLYDDAGGAYQHESFAEHRQYLVDRMCAGQPHSYVPESGYWVAFDNSIPTYLPLYVYSRWRDIEGLKQENCGPLDNHVLFTTGWEWGYWLHDMATLRTTYEHAASPGELIAHAYAPDLGSAAAAVIDKLVTEQKRALIDERLAGYVASRDVIIDAGRQLDPPIISQPDRVLFEHIASGAADLATFETNVLGPLDAHAAALEALDDELRALRLPSSRWSREVLDGFAIDRLRARFMHAAYSAVVAHARGASPDAHYQRAAALLAEAKRVVRDRHEDLHDTHRRRLLDRTPNKTVYQYGYLYHADILCYWQRELGQVGNLLGKTTESPPGCLF